MNDTFTAIYSEPVQIGPDEWKQVRSTKEFSYNSTMNEVMDWLKCLGVKEPDINSVYFARHESKN